MAGPLPGPKRLSRRLHTPQKRGALRQAQDKRDRRTPELWTSSAKNMDFLLSLVDEFVCFWRRGARGTEFSAMCTFGHRKSFAPRDSRQNTCNAFHMCTDIVT